MDWVDWSESRASGKTFTFELWHAFTLKRIAALHEEFSASFGNASAAKVYRVSRHDYSAAIWVAFFSRCQRSELV